MRRSNLKLHNITIIQMGNEASRLKLLKFVGLRKWFTRLVIQFNDFFFHCICSMWLSLICARWRSIWMREPLLWGIQITFEKKIYILIFLALKAQIQDSQRFKKIYSFVWCLPPRPRCKWQGSSIWLPNYSCNYFQKYKLF